MLKIPANSVGSTRSLVKINTSQKIILLLFLQQNDIFKSTVCIFLEQKNYLLNIFQQILSSKKTLLVLLVEGGCPFYVRWLLRCRKHKLVSQKKQKKKHNKNMTFKIIRFFLSFAKKVFFYLHFIFGSTKKLL